MAYNGKDTWAGGVGRHMHFIGKELEKKGNVVDFIFAENVPKLIPSKGFNFPIALDKMIRELHNKNNYDVINIHAGWGWFYGARKKYLNKSLPPLIVTIHGVEEIVHNEWKIENKLLPSISLSLRKRISALIGIEYLKFSTKFANHVITVSNQDRDFIIQKYGIEPENITYVPNGVSKNFIIKRDFNKKEECFRMLFVGTWDWRKGKHYLINTFININKIYPNIHLSLIGTGKNKNELLEDFPPQFHNKVTIYDSVSEDELINIYRKNHVLILPSLAEGMPLVVLEAMATGMPIIAFSVSGIPDIVEDGKEGLLAPPRNVKKLSDNLIFLIENNEELKRMGMNGQEKIKNFTWERIAKDTLEVYQKIN